MRRRVTVLGLTVCVCVCVCLSVFLFCHVAHLGMQQKLERHKRTATKSAILSHVLHVRT